MEFGSKLADFLRQGADTLVNLPTEAQRFITNPQAFTELVTGKNPLPKETGFVAGASGLPPKNPAQGGVLNPASAPYQEGYEQGEPVAIAAMALPAYATALRAGAPKAYNALENYMVKSGGMIPLEAYHGTPHKIEGAFDINKVGTGEGAQAYGHGMYFAENPAVAKQYIVNDQLQKTPEGMARSYAQQYPSEKEALAGAKQRLQRLLDSGDVVEAKTQEQVVKALESGKLGGNLYKVDIPDEHIPMMMDYDKPIKDQPEILSKVRGLIKDPDILQTFDKNVESGITGANVYANYIPTGIDKFDLFKQRDQLLNKYMTKDMGMSEAVKTMNAEDKLAFNEIAQKIDDLKNKPKIVSKVLNEAGIKGIKYLDQGSRGKGGTSNFVVFEPSDVKILEENSKPVARKELLKKQFDKLK